MLGAEELCICRHGSLRNTIHTSKWNLISCLWEYSSNLSLRPVVAGRVEAGFQVLAMLEKPGQEPRLVDHVNSNVLELRRQKHEAKVQHSTGGSDQLLVGPCDGPGGPDLLGQLERYTGPCLQGAKRKPKLGLCFRNLPRRLWMFNDDRKIAGSCWR